ncbi:O-antigen ligase family protein [Arthrobacter sp. B1I2]|uniref:O-antigen ligase family protein n=1 Tax=Arthrobacter sp. B1I2 TaxID=3042263 RepID=UPI00278349FA|nr:O-antigen ligase family protein [Arthrobacter sp. B1I2]MDQ0731138.1 O-antigen ligase [Arthrobacter sp. B1I2]
MKLTNQNDVGAVNKSAPGIILIVTSVVAVVAGFFDIRYSFGAFAALAVLALVQSIGLGRFLPKAPVGWLYALVIFVTCWAPALGTVGTISRFVLAGVCLVALIHSFSLPAPRMNKAAKAGVVILLVSLILSTLGAASSAYGLSRLLNWTMFIPLLWLGFRRPDIRGAGFGLVVTSIFQMIGVGLQMAGLMKGTWGGLLTSGLTYNPETSSWLTRYTGFTMNPNNLALVLACGVIVLAACLLADLPRRTKVGFLMLMGLFAVGIVLTGSRGGLVAVAIGVVVLFFFAGKRGVALGITVLGLAIVAYVITGSRELDRLLQSFIEIVSGVDASATQRSNVWLTRLQSTQNGNMFIGTGFGGYAPELFAGQHGLDVDPASARRATVDNSWLKILLESGVLGMFAMALTMLAPMCSALWKSTGDRRLWGIAAGAVIAALIWRSISVDMLDQNPWNAFVFIALGLAAASTAPRPDDEPEAAQKQGSALLLRRGVK